MSQTYTVTAYWLRQRMNKVDEADAVLHEGLRNNPGSYDILFELGRLYDESYHDTNRARNVWELAASANGTRQLDPETQKRQPAHLWSRSPRTSPSWRRTPAICRAAIDWFRDRAKRFHHAGRHPEAD